MAEARSAGSSARLARPSIRSQARWFQSSSQRSMSTVTSARRSMSRMRASWRGSVACFGFSSIGVNSTSPSRTKQIGTRRGRPSSAIVPSVAVRASDDEAGLLAGQRHARTPPEQASVSGHLADASTHAEASHRPTAIACRRIGRSAAQVGSCTTAELVGASVSAIVPLRGSIAECRTDAAAAASGVRARGCPHRDDERLPARDRPEQQGDRLGLEREPEQLDRRGELGLHLGDSSTLRPISAEISAAAIPRKWRAIRYSLTTSATSVNATLIGTSAIDGWRPAPNTTPWPTMNPTATATIPTCQLVIATTPYHSAVARTAPMAPPMTPPAMSPIVAGSAGCGCRHLGDGDPAGERGRGQRSRGDRCRSAASGAAGTALVPIADAGVATAPLGSSWMAPRIPPQL